MQQPPNPPETPSGIALLETYGRILWRRRRMIGLQMLVVVVVSTIIVLLLPPWYRGRTELMPPQDAEGGMSLTSLLAGVKVPGVSLPGAATPDQVYSAILRSRWVGERLVTQFDLKKSYHTKSLDDALDALHKHTSISTSDEGTLVIAVEDKGRTRCAEMANAYVAALDEFNRAHRTTRGKSMRVFTERRLRETADSLARAEEELAAYQSLHKSAALGADPRGGASDATGRILAERMAMAVKLDALRGAFTEGSPEIRETANSLAALDRQLSKLPQTGLAAARMYRSVKVQEQLFTLLTAQYEEARILEARDTPTIEVIDRAVAPDKRFKPRRKVVIATVAALALVWGAVLAFVLEMRATRSRA